MNAITKNKEKIKNIKLIDYLHYFLFSIILLTNIMFFNNNIYILYLSVIYFLIVTAFDFSNGLILFIISLPANQVMTQNLSTVNYVLILMTILFGIYLLKSVGTSMRIDKKSFIYIFVFLLTNVFALSLNITKINRVMSYYGMLIISMLFVFIYINSSKIDHLYVKSKFAFVLSAVNIIVLILHFNNWSFIGFTDRIYLDEIIEIRRVADFLAPAIIILLSELIFKKDKQFDRITILSKALLLITLIYFLVLTGTRGVVYAVVSSILFVLFIRTFKNFKISLKGLGMVMLIITSGIFIYYFSPDFTSRLLDIDNTSRFNIWLNGIKQLHFTEFIFGRGLNRFWELSLMGNLVSSSGTGYSAHSLYLDVLTSSGIVSLVILILMFYFLFKKAIKNRNHLNITLTLYLMIAALTGIPVINISFWTIIAFIYISTKTFSKHDKIEKEGFNIENEKGNI